MITGDMFLDTTHNDTYTNITGDHRPTRVEQRSTLAVPSNKKGTFQSQTQNRFDFPGYKNGQPIRARPIEPAPTTIDLRFDNKYGMHFLCVSLTIKEMLLLNY